MREGDGVPWPAACADFLIFSFDRARQTKGWLRALSARKAPASQTRYHWQLHDIPPHEKIELNSCMDASLIRPFGGTTHGARAICRTASTWLLTPNPRLLPRHAATPITPTATPRPSRRTTARPLLAGRVQGSWASGSASTPSSLGIAPCPHPPHWCALEGTMRDEAPPQLRGTIPCVLPLRCPRFETDFRFHLAPAVAFGRPVPTLRRVPLSRRVAASHLWREQPPLFGHLLRRPPCAPRPRRDARAV